MKKRLLLLSFLFLSLSYCFSEKASTNVTKGIPAFPGAEGGGMYTTGGRGGAVYYVNTLEDNSQGDIQTREGSLRWCIEQNEPRTILFKVDGTIRLNKALHISNGNMTIAGQSATGGGICIANYPVSVSADNVIIRYMRFRMGDLVISEKEADGADALNGRQSENVLIDHCSISWSTDECSSFYDNKNFTMQWCIISESLRLSGHSKGPHGYGAIWGGVNATFHHNLIAHHDSRTPRLGPGKKYAGTDTTDVRNNVFYNWSGHGCYGGEAMHVNMINNYYKAGPATQGNIAKRLTTINVKVPGGGWDEIKDVWGKYYIAGNVFSHAPEITVNNWLGVETQDNKDKKEIKMNQPIAVEKIHTHDATTAYEKVLQYVGCSKVRDQIDQRIIEETSTGTAKFKGLSKHNGQGGQWKSQGYPKGGLIDSVTDLNPDPNNKDWSPWPELKKGTPIQDSDRDGIPDDWLAENYPSKQASDTNIEGYTYLEVYLNSLVEDITNNQK